MPAATVVRLGELAVRFGCELRGDPAVEVRRVGTLQGAQSDAIAFLANAQYRRHLAGTRAAAVLLREADAARCATAALVCANPYATYARIAAFLHPEPPSQPGVHPAASLAEGVELGADVQVAALARIEAGARLGARCAVGPGCVLLEGVVLGPDTRLVANVTLGRGVSIGARGLVHPGAVIGADGFGQAPDVDGYVKVPQLGSVRIGDDVEIGANTAIDRGAIDDTIVEDGVKIDNLVQIGHNCRIGAHTVIAGAAAIAGSVTIGRGCMIGGGVGIVGHIEICEGVIVTARSLVTGSIRQPGTYSGSLPADEAGRFRRNAARFRQLDASVRRQRGSQGAADPDGGHDDD